MKNVLSVIDSNEAGCSSAAASMDNVLEKILDIYNGSAEQEIRLLKAGKNKDDLLEIAMALLGKMSQDCPVLKRERILILMSSLQVVNDDIYRELMKKLMQVGLTRVFALHQRIIEYFTAVIYDLSEKQEQILLIQLKVIQKSPIVFRRKTIEDFFKASSDKKKYLDRVTPVVTTETMEKTSNHEPSENIVQFSPRKWLQNIGF